MAEHILLDRTFRRTSDELLEQLGRSEARSEQTHIWLFEDRQSRQAIAAELVRHGIQAKVRSAYKPLVHFFLEEVSAEGLTAINIAYPVDSAWPQQRFRLEAYPLAGMFPGVKLSFEAEPASPTGTQANTWYRVQLYYGEQCHTHNVFAPNLLRDDFLGQTVCSPTAWLMACTGDETRHTPLQSAYQQCYDAVMTAVSAHEWSRSEPYFDRLVVRADLPGIERRLDVGHETINTTEAMHEESTSRCSSSFNNTPDENWATAACNPDRLFPIFA